MFEDKSFAYFWIGEKGDFFPEKRRRPDSFFFITWHYFKKHQVIRLPSEIQIVVVMTPDVNKTINCSQMRPTKPQNGRILNKEGDRAPKTPFRKDRFQRLVHSIQLGKDRWSSRYILAKARTYWRRCQRC